MSRVIADTSELDDLARDLVTAADRAMDQAVAVTERGALNIKRDARQRVDAAITRTYLPHYPRSIDYDIDEDGLTVTAEIGPRTDMLQGSFGPGVELGSVNTPPIPHMFPAFEDELPRYLRMLGRHAGEVVL